MRNFLKWFKKKTARSIANMRPIERMLMQWRAEDPELHGLRRIETTKPEVIPLLTGSPGVSGPPGGSIATIPAASMHMPPGPQCTCRRGRSHNNREV